MERGAFAACRISTRISRAPTLHPTRGAAHVRCCCRRAATSVRRFAERLTPSSSSQEQAATLVTALPQFTAAGYGLAVVGVGSVEQAKTFAHQLTPPFPLDKLFADPSRALYTSLGLYTGFGAFSPSQTRLRRPPLYLPTTLTRLSHPPRAGRTFLAPSSYLTVHKRGMGALRAATQNYVPITLEQKSTGLQQGGVFVVDGDVVRLAWKDKATGVHAQLPTILAACCGGGCGCGGGSGDGEGATEPRVAAGGAEREQACARVSLEAGRADACHGEGGGRGGE